MITGFTMADAVTPLEKEMESHLRHVIDERNMLWYGFVKLWESCGVSNTNADHLVQQVVDRAHGLSKRYEDLITAKFCRECGCHEAVNEAHVLDCPLHP